MFKVHSLAKSGGTSLRVGLLLILALVASIFVYGPVLANPSGDDHVDPPGVFNHKTLSGEVMILHPWMEPANVGANSRLFMVIENEEAFHISLVKIDTPVAEKVELQFDTGDDKVGVLSSRVIGSEESLNVDSHHMWFQLRNLKVNLKPGDTYPARIFFNDGRVMEITVQVGPPGAS